ncbi:LysR family transcriptional activator of glutamate synthase operon [Chryseomicrobium aureum]|uniref:LysR family transcriptional regulator n=1 Tax=Chryseomicrobium aureum TaxID=1441723 RepID=UPI0019570725|nr:LysR family transcriptional regulator [Chryseomicrobium aureum]MBM7705575.1 LysR family transcriptional activator of glutamate synthase operon [Chryseomicrobium aureum]
MELRQLIYFQEVAKREHISEAALQLHVAQSAISRQIANLEKELGVQLFDRIGRNVKLTSIGRDFLKHTERALAEINYGLEEIGNYLDPEKGTIRIGFPSSFATQLLPSVITAFRKEHPDVEFQLRQGNYHFLIDAVKERSINLSFIGPLPAGDPDLETTELFTESFSLVVPLQHRLASQRSVHLSELKKEPFIVFPEEFVLHKTVIQACQSVGFVPQVSSIGEDLDAIKGLVAAGLGISILPDSTLPDGSLRLIKKIQLTTPTLSRSVGLITPATRILTPSEKVFIEFSKDFFKRMNQYL